MTREGPTSKITLDPRSRHRNSMGSLAARFLSTPPKMVLIPYLKDVWHQIVTLNGQVFHDSVHLRVTELGPRNRNVANILKNGRNDDVGEILDEIFFEGWSAILIIA